jgi:DNA polymerase-1
MMPVYESVQSVDFEYYSKTGGNPTPVCMVSHDLISGKIHRVWLHQDEEGDPIPSCPISVDYNTLYLTYSAGAEVGCHITLGWPIPERVVDTMVEFRVITNGIPGLEKPKILDACKFFGVGTSTTEEYKTMMRDRILAGPSYSAEERIEIMDYCQEDVRIQSELFLKMRDYLDGDRTLLRGEYMKVMTKMQYRGIPLDTEVLTLMEKHLETLQQRMIQEVDADFNCYVGKTFKIDRFEDYLVKHGILTWPRTPSGRLSLEDGVFRDAVQLHKELQPLRDLRYLIGTMRLNSLAVGADGRNRAYLLPIWHDDRQMHTQLC